MSKLVSPLCRVGRKKPIQQKVINKSPKDFSIYVEPFVGSGDVFFAMNLDPTKVKSYINDKDSDVATAFKIMKSNPNIDNIAKFKNMSLEQVRSFVKGKFLLSINDSAEIRETFKDFRIIGLSVEGGGQKGTDLGTKVRKELFIKNY